MPKRLILSIIALVMIGLIMPLYAQEKKEDFWEDNKPTIERSRNKNNFDKWDGKKDKKADTFELKNEKRNDFIFIRHHFRTGDKKTDLPILFMPAVERRYIKMVSLETLSMMASKSKSDYRIVSTIIKDTLSKARLKIEFIEEGEIEE